MISQGVTMLNTYTYTIDEILDGLLSILYTNDYKEQLVTIFKLLDYYNNPIDSTILNKINNNDVDDSTLSEFIINTTKLELNKLFISNNIVVKADADLLTYYNILYILITIKDIEPFLLVHVLDILENSEYDNIEKISHIVNDFTNTVYPIVYDIVDYVPDTLINNLTIQISEIVTASELSDTDTLMEYSNLIYLLLKRDNDFYKTTFYINFNSGNIDTDINVYTNDIKKDLNMYLNKSISLNTLCNSIIGYLIISDNHLDKYNTYVSIVADVIFDDLDESIITDITKRINIDLPILLNQYTSGETNDV